MIWLAWRQFRVQAVVAAVALAALAVIVLITGSDLRHIHDTSGVAACRAACIASSGMPLVRRPCVALHTAVSAAAIPMPSTTPRARSMVSA